MAPAKRTVATIVQAARTANDAANDHENNAAKVDAEVQRLEAEAVDLLVEDPSRADEVGRKIDAQTRLAGAYRAKARGKRAEVEDLKKDALYLEAAELDAEGERLDREHEKHEGKIAALIKQLEDLDGVPYIRKPEESPGYGEGIRILDNSTGDEIEGRAKGARLRATVNRFYLQFGEPPRHSTQITGEWSLTIPNAHIPLAHTLDPENSRSPLLRGIIDGTWLDEDTAA